MERISLKHLCRTPHPLVRRGFFSVFNDPLVRGTDEVDVSFDIDGLVLVSKYVSIVLGDA